MKFLPVLLTAALWLGLVRGADICTPTDDKVKVTQTVPKEFSVDIEVVHQESDMVQNVRMYYSKSMKTIRQDIHTMGQKYSQFYYFNEDQVLTFISGSGRGNCTVKNDISKDLENYMLTTDIKSSDRGLDILMPLPSVHFIATSGFTNDSKTSHTEIPNPGKVRNLNVKAYQTCQKWKSNKTDIVVQVKHYYAVDSLIFPWENRFIQREKPSNLLKVEVEGVGTIGGKSGQYIKHSYNYHNFQLGIESVSVLETPDGIPCSGRVSKTPLPSLPDNIRFQAEIIDPDRNEFWTVEENYDFNRKIAVSRKLVGSGRLTEVVDFISGWKYQINTYANICKRQFINETLGSSLFYENKDGKATMFSPKEYFNVDKPFFSHLGMKKVRGLMTDTFVSFSEPFHGDYNGVIQWHFAPELRTVNDKNYDYQKNKWAYPIQYKLWRKPDTLSPLTINFYNVKYESLTAKNIDMTTCFNFIKAVRFELKVSIKDFLVPDMAVSVNEVTHQVMKYSGLRDIQITNVQIFFGSGTHISGHFILMSDNQLKHVIDKLSAAVKAKKISLTLTDQAAGNVTKSLPWESFSMVRERLRDATIKDPATSSSGTYGPGDMAVLGIGVLVMGLLVGLACGFLYKKFFMRPEV